MKTESLSTLKIHKLTKAQYDRELAAGRIDENALYLTPDEGIADATTSDSGLMSPSDKIKLDGVASTYATKTELAEDISSLENSKSDKDHTHDNYSGVGKDVSTSGIAGAEIFNDYTNNVASGKYSHAEGYATTSSGDHSHAEGSSTTASLRAAHAEGQMTLASGWATHAEGIQSQATGKSSHAEGIYTIAQGMASHAQGKHNIVDTEEKYAHIVGNGESPAARSNAHTLNWDGTAWFANEVKIGGTGQDDTSAKTLATTEYVDAHSQKTSSNPHNVTKSDVGLGNVENKSSAAIRGELTKDNVTTALGYTPPTTEYIDTLELITTEDIDAVCIIVIDFTIQDVAYQAIEGMTWGEWVNSAYNTGGFFVSAENSEISNSEGDSVCEITGGGNIWSNVTDSFVIIPNFNYSLSHIEWW